MTPTALNFNALPLVAAEHVFSFLDLETRKAASLVCRYWHDLAFANRLMRRVILDVSLWNPSQLQENLRVLRNTSRYYRYMQAFEKLNEERFEVLLSILDIIGVELVGFYGSVNAEQLRQIVERTPFVEQLYLVFTGSSEGNLLQFPVLEHLRECRVLGNFLQTPAIDIPRVMPNLCKFRALVNNCENGERSLRVMRELAPGLVRLELFSSHIRIEELYFPRMETLILGEDIIADDRAVQRRFFERLTTLKDVNLQFEVDNCLLDILTTRCSKLHTMRLQMNTVDARSFQYLNRLKNLKTLAFTGSLHSSMLTKDCEPVPSVETAQLHLDDINDAKAIVEHMVKLLPNVVELSIMLPTVVGIQIGRLLPTCAKFGQLQRVHFTPSYDRANRVTFTLTTDEREEGMKIEEL